MDLKEPGNVLLLAGLTRLELGGSHWAMIRDQPGGRVPRVDPGLARALFRAVHAAIVRGLVRSCHDLSEGGLAVALAEMALAGGLGAGSRSATCRTRRTAAHAVALLFSESPSRFLLEVRPEHVDALAAIFDGLPLGRLGEVVGPPDAAGPAPPRLTVLGLDAEPRDRCRHEHSQSRLAAPAPLVSGSRPDRRTRDPT